MVHDIVHVLLLVSAPFGAHIGYRNLDARICISFGNSSWCFAMLKLVLDLVLVTELLLVLVLSTRHDSASH